MPESIKLSDLASQIQETINNEFEGQVYWIKAQITNVKKMEDKKWCYLSFEEYENGRKAAEIRAVFWTSYYTEIEKFEKLTNQVFKNGIEITCKVKVRYNKIYGLNLDVLQIDIAHTIGSLELERKKTIERLLAENPKVIQFFDGRFLTYNNRLQLPDVIKKIALITAPNSDGQNDFIKEVTNNKYGYTFTIHEFLTTIQGDNAHKLILEKLKIIEQEDFDVVAIVRGGGGQSDFKPFDDYELCKHVAAFPIPIITGIGHDRNQSIVDQMAREQKTPTKVANLIVEHNFVFEHALMDLKNRIYDLINYKIENAKSELANAKRIIKISSPETILNRGFAIVMSENKIITDPNLIKEDSEIQTILGHQTITSKVVKKKKNEKGIEL